MHPDFRPEAGISSSVRFRVDESMLAGFGGAMIHPVLSTATLVYYLEWAGRKLIEPYLEPEEEGVGHAISVVHRAPAFPGSEVTASATLARYEGNRVVAAVAARDAEGRLIAEGEFTQVILPRAVVAARLRPQAGASGSATA